MSLAAIASGAAGFAHGKLWSHETDIAVLKQVGSDRDRRLDDIATKLDRILDEMRKHP